MIETEADKITVNSSPYAVEVYHRLGFTDALSTDDWQKRLEYIENVTGVYKEYITANDLLPKIDLNAPSLEDELIWAERLKAWENPNWRDWITGCTKKALEVGCPEKDFWVWSLWS